MDGMTGRLFREFSIVISGSVIISSFAALTFTPMLATKLLIKREKQSWFYAKTEPFFEGMNRLYSRSLAAFLNKRWIALPFTFITICLIGVLWNAIPAEMAPLEDRSQISINTRGAEGVTYEYIRDYTEDINQLVDSILPDAESVTARVSSGSGNIQITLKDIKLKSEQYQPVSSKRIYIPKKNGSKRPLGIPSFDDKLVQEVIRMILEAIYEDNFESCSHGFRPNRGCHTALSRIKDTFTGSKWFVEGDIKGFFDNIDHDILIRILEERISDNR